MIKKTFSARNLSSLFLGAVLSALVFSCASTPEKTVGGFSSGSFEGNPTPVEEEKTAISAESDAGRKNKSYTYFSRIDESIMTEVEIGSPSSLRKAASALRRSEGEFGDPERVLLAVEANIMQLVWTNERVDWESPAISSDTPYMGAINSAKNGIYDMSTGNVDFLTILLPSLVVTKVQDVSGFFAESEKALQKCLSIRNNSVLAFYLLGTLYKKAGDLSRALVCFKNASQLAPECFQTAYAYAEALYLSGAVKDADSVSRQLVLKYQSNIQVLKLCANIAYDLKDYNSAEENISRVLQQDPNDLPSVLFRARILIEKKDYIHAASLLDMYSRQDSTSKDYLLLRARIQYDWSKNTIAAVSTIESALKNYPDDSEVLLFAARISAAANVPVAGKYVEDYANAVFEKDPSNEEALKYAVEGAILKKNWKKAYELSQTLVSKKTVRENLFNHIKICLALKKYDEAWNMISPIYRSNSNDEDVVQCYVQVMVQSGRTQQASGLINQLLPTASSKLKSFLYYQRSYIQASEEALLSDLRASLIANPRNSDALFRLYEIYYAKKDYRKAQYYLKQVVALNPSDSEVRKLNEELTNLLK